MVQMVTISKRGISLLSQLEIDSNLAMGAHNITLGAGQTVDGVDVGTIEAGAEANINKVSASDVLQHSNDTPVTHTGDTLYAKKKTIRILYYGTWRINFDLKTSAAATAAKAKIYKNGVDVGAVEHATNSESYVTKIEDIAFDVGDTCELWLRIMDAGEIASAQNFRLLGDMSEARGVNE